MQLQSFFRTAIILTIIALNCYAIAKGIKNQSSWGVILATGSLIAMSYGLYLWNKLKESARE